MFYASGMNHYNVDLKGTSIHAEVDAVSKLKYNHKSKPIKVNIIVLRVNNKGDRLLLSKSCEPCMKYMRTHLHLKNYKVHKAWYTDNDGQFIQFKI
jgi:hypothetical protein